MKRRLMYLAGKIALIAAVGWIVANYMFGVVQVPDAGMYPKLMAGDLLFYSRMEKQYYIGDVVSVSVDKTEYVLRVVAQGGDIVDFSEDGFLLVDGQVQTEEIMQESYPLEGSDITYPYTVPQGSFFLLGDARTECIDSRMFGAVTKQQLNGKVIGCFRHRQF